MSTKTSTTSRQFDLGDVLTITDGCLLSPRHMHGVYDILNFMTGDDIYTHQIPRAMRACRIALLAKYPDLANVDRSTKITPETLIPWLNIQKRIYGETLSVEPLAPQSWITVDPMLEAQALVGKDRVVSVEVPR